MCTWLLAAVLLGPAGLQPGSITDLSGEWLYRPGYSQHYAPVRVPQFLNRVEWWLDDSEHFKTWETARLKRLGFDTDRAEDGWYRLPLDVPALPSGRHLWIEFDGVAMKSRTVLNGHTLGEHTGMFSRFAYDLTPYLKPGRNQLEVYASMERVPVSTLSLGQAVTVNLTASKVLTLSKGMFGPLSPAHDNRAYDLHGIWQPVRLVARGAGRIDDAWFVPALDAGEVRVEASGGARVRATWEGLGSAGPVPLAGGKAVLRLAHIRPRLWTPAAPNLYRMEVTLESASGELLDRVVRKVGFRTFEARGNQLYLNGHPYWLRGANQLPYGKNPWDPELARRLIRYLHDANVRVTRTHATPWNEAWLDAADEIGLGVSIEGIRPWALAGLIGGPPPPIFQHWLMENEDVVRRCRNHPSVLIWTVGNEMLLRDGKNLEKWRLLSQVVKQTRRLDPTRPVVCSSDYTRDPEFYAKVLKPAGIDDGDFDDIHRYRGWYAASPFVATDEPRTTGRRPFIGQEMSTGYPDLDTGRPVRRYTVDMITPQAWVGDRLDLFLEHHRAVTKRWAEQLRFERNGRTAGFMLFSTECWFSDSFDPARLKPYPVLDAVRQAFSPVGLALETGRRRFFAGDTIDTAVFITDDDDGFRSFRNLRLEVGAQSFPVPSLKYYETVRVPVRLHIPAAGHRLVLRLLAGGREISRTADPIEIAPRQPCSWGGALVVRHGAEWKSRVERGATAILLNPGKELVSQLPDAVQDYRAVTGEFADWSPAAGTPLAAGLGPMDLKWWARKDDWRVFVATGAHRLRRGGPARELVRFIPAHSYIPAEKVPDQYYSVVFEVPVGKGRVLVCDLDLDASIDLDPAARRFARNLVQMARQGN